jgi:hypothetical protein
VIQSHDVNAISFEGDPGADILNQQFEELPPAGV